MKTLLATCAAVLIGSLTYAGESPQLISSNKMLGASIYDAKENAIADINSIVLDKSGTPHFIIAGVGGLAGVGETEVAIPWSAASMKQKKADDSTECHVSVSMTQEKLSKAPALKGKDYAELEDKEWLKTNAKYYSAEAPKKAVEHKNAICVKSITDANVTGAGNKSVGHLDAVMMSTKDGKAVFGIIGDGGTIGVNETYKAVPFSSLKVSYDEEMNPKVSLDASKTNLKNAPKVTPSDYPELELESVRQRITSADGAAE